VRDRRLPLLLVLVALAVFPSAATATPVCISQPDWSDWYFSYPGGCTIGDTVVSNFAWSTNISGAASLKFPTPIISGDSFGVELTLLDTAPFTASAPFSAGANQTKTFGISFTTTDQSGGLLASDLFSLLGVQVTGTGSVQATDVICLNGIITSIPLVGSPTCSSGLTATATSLTPDLSALAVFGPVGSIGTALVVTISGGTNGTATLTGLRMLATEAPTPVPEPSTVLLLGTGLAALARARTRERR
jgi:hypothetical protein